MPMAALARPGIRLPAFRGGCRAKTPLPDSLSAEQRRRGSWRDAVIRVAQERVGVAGRALCVANREALPLVGGVLDLVKDRHRHRPSGDLRRAVRRDEQLIPPEHDPRRLAGNELR